MANVVFYEKPGCGGNARQKALLIASGHAVDVRNLLTETWTVSSLRQFFEGKPLREWFNAASPRLKSGEIKPDQLTPEAALAMMLEDPLLIRRPLMQVGDRREAGFDQSKVEAWIGLQKMKAAVNDICLNEQSLVHRGRRCRSTTQT